MKKYILFVAIIALGFCGGVERRAHMPAGNEDPTHEGEPPDHEHQELKLSPEKQKEWGVDTGTVVKQDISSLIVLPEF